MPDRLDHLRHRVEHAPSDPDALTQLGTLYLEQGRFEEANALLCLALEIDPGWHPASISLAICRNSTRDRDGAIEVLTAAAEEARRNEDADAFDLVRDTMESMTRND
ncbi:MAG: hypothetical protein CMJ40_11945 [Phycisphaerae bacterium]|nr:hypothetical protein [Phycisphaerae bacterium]|tara:strand:- start:34930 stop:35250 length:321 start_codon:yes stop_codon:yes gene_type:complete